MTSLKNYKSTVVPGPDGTRRIRLVPRPDEALLDAVREAAERTPKKTQALHDVVTAAAAGGHAVADIASAAAVSRQAIYSIINSQTTE